MSTNQGPEYFAAEKKYLSAQSPEEQILWLGEMIRNFKKHKGSENMLANIKQRLKKLLEKKERIKKSGKITKKSIRKEGYQCALVGLTNSGKSSLLAKLTNAQPRIDAYAFTTKEPELGTLNFEGVKAQVVDLPSLGSEAFDMGIANTADLLIIVLEKLEDLPLVEKSLLRAVGNRLIVINKSDLLDADQLRKLQQTLQSKRIPGIIVSSLTSYGISELKERIVRNMGIIRIYTKEPGKPHSNIPVVLPLGSAVKNVAESILKGFSSRVKETRLTGPSSKFPNQKVGLSHILKDKDIVEFHTI